MMIPANTCARYNSCTSRCIPSAPLKKGTMHTTYIGYVRHVIAPSQLVYVDGFETGARTPTCSESWCPFPCLSLLCNRFRSLYSHQWSLLLSLPLPLLLLLLSNMHVHICRQQLNFWLKRMCALNQSHSQNLRNPGIIHPNSQRDILRQILRRHVGQGQKVSGKSHPMLRQGIC